MTLVHVCSLVGMFGVAWGCWWVLCCLPTTIVPKGKVALPNEATLQFNLSQSVEVEDTLIQLEGKTLEHFEAKEI